MCLCLLPRESLLAEMGVSIKEDGGTLGVFSPKGVSLYIIIYYIILYYIIVPVVLQQQTDVCVSV